MFFSFISRYKKNVKEASELSPLLQEGNNNKTERTVDTGKVPLDVIFNVIKTVIATRLLSIRACNAVCALVFFYYYHQTLNRIII